MGSIFSSHFAFVPHLQVNVYGYFNLFVCTFLVNYNVSSSNLFTYLNSRVRWFSLVRVLRVFKFYVIKWQCRCKWIISISIFTNVFLLASCCCLEFTLKYNNRDNFSVNSILVYCFYTGKRVFTAWVRIASGILMWDRSSFFYHEITNRTWLGCLTLSYEYQFHWEMERPRGINYGRLWTEREIHDVGPRGAKHWVTSL